MLKLDSQMGMPNYASLSLIATSLMTVGSQILRAAKMQQVGRNARLRGYPQFVLRLGNLQCSSQADSYPFPSFGSYAIPSYRAA